MTASNVADARDRLWMRRALALARRGQGATRPNPMVGAVVVAPGGRRIGEGFHRRAGTAHAEINALAALSGPAAGATVYVTLEPCCHMGRTAPCTTALIAARVGRVVVGVRDPNPLVNGKGIARLRRAGIRVDVGCLEERCRELNRPFFKWIGERRPLVTLKAAATLDGFIADRSPRRNAKPAWITGTAARAATHRMRREHDAILVGAGTVIVDNPLLTVRVPERRRTSRRDGSPRGPGVNPPFLRVILDARLRIPPTAAVLPAVPDAQTLVVATTAASPKRVRAIQGAGAEVLLLPARGRGRVDLARLLQLLAERDIQSLMVEGGSEVHGAFIAAGLVDRVAVFLAPRLLGGGVPMARPAGVVGRALSSALSLGPMTVRRVGDDLLIRADVRATPAMPRAPSPRARERERGPGARR